MDYTAKQEVMKIIHDMEPEDALQIARSILDAVDARACIWEAGDIDTVLDERHYAANFTDEERTAIKTIITASYEWRTLSDPTEDNWDTVNSAVYEAGRALGIDLDRNDG